MDEKELVDPDDYNKLDQILDDALSANGVDELYKVIDDAKSFMDVLKNRAER